MKIGQFLLPWEGQYTTRDVFYHNTCILGKLIDYNCAGLQARYSHLLQRTVSCCYVSWDQYPYLATLGSSVGCVGFGKGRNADCKNFGCCFGCDWPPAFKQKFTVMLKGWSCYKTCSQLLAASWRSQITQSRSACPGDSETPSNSADSPVPSPLPAKVLPDSLPAPSLLVLTQHLNLHLKPSSQLNEWL